MDAVKPETKPRWYRLTADRLIVGLLAVEGFLWLSQRFQWFRFNVYQGWAVLFDVGCVGLFLLALFLWWIIALLFHLRFQFYIRSLLLLTIAVAAACGWLQVERSRTAKQEEAVKAFYKLGGLVSWNPQPKSWGPRPDEPTWLQELLGEEFFRFNSYLSITDRKVVDSDLKCIMPLQGLEDMRFVGLGITDSALEYIQPMAELQYLDLSENKLTDMGLRKLRGLRRLRTLILCDNDITDAGLKNLEALSALESLALFRTKVSAEGIKKLQQALPNCKIVWSLPN